MGLLMNWTPSSSNTNNISSPDSKKESLIFSSISRFLYPRLVVDLLDLNNKLFILFAAILGFSFFRSIYKSDFFFSGNRTCVSGIRDSREKAEEIGSGKWSAGDRWLIVEFCVFLDVRCDLIHFCVCVF